MWGRGDAGTKRQRNPLFPWGRVRFASVDLRIGHLALLRLITHHSSLITFLWSVLSVVAALAVLLAADLVLFRNAIQDGQVYYRSDTVTYYFPIASRLVDVMREGRLLLWTRYIFGGFPLFADGEAGMLYPPNLLARLLLPEAEAFIWLRVARYFMAATFTYAYLRSLRLNGFAATVGALSFSFGSFMVMQMHHTNVVNTAIWLPLTLLMIEMALRNVRRWRWLYVTFAGTAVGIQSLGLHIQPLLMSGFFLALYIPFRVLLCPIAWPAPRGKRERHPAPKSAQLAAAIYSLALHKVVPKSGIEAPVGVEPPAEASMPGEGQPTAVAALGLAVCRGDFAIEEPVSSLAPASLPSTHERGANGATVEASASGPILDEARHEEGRAPTGSDVLDGRENPTADGAKPAMEASIPEHRRQSIKMPLPGGPRLAAAVSALTSWMAQIRVSPRDLIFGTLLFGPPPAAEKRGVLEGRRQAFAAWSRASGFAMRVAQRGCHYLLALWTLAAKLSLRIRQFLQSVMASTVRLARRARRFLKGQRLFLAKLAEHGNDVVLACIRWTLRMLSSVWGFVSPGLPVAARSLRAIVRWVARFLERTFHRTAMAVLFLGIIPAVAFGIAAVQVLPLVELGLFSFRGTGVNYQFATSYSMPVQNLVDLVFPYFFRYTNRFYWSLWSEWETTIYVGIAPLVLATIAVIFVRRRLVLFYLAAATAATLLAFGNYSPYPLYEQLWHLPGFSSLRVPGRFTMLVTFSAAVLAAFGADWLCRTLVPRSAGGQRSRWDRLSRLIGVNGFALYLLGLLTAMAGVVWWLLSFRLWIEKEPWAVKKLVEDSYLSLRNSRPWLTSDMVLNFLNYSLDPTNEKTSISLALMLATFLLLFCWFAFRRLWRVWATALVALVAVDMLLFALDFHPTVHINQLTTPDSASRWLMAHNSDGMERVYTAPEVRKTEANKLLPFRVADITGYSSLETIRHQEYMSALNRNDKTLVDLYGVRYVILPKRFPALPSYEYTAYYPDRPLADGPAGNRGAHPTFYMIPPVKADEVCIVSNLRDATDIPQDADVADIVVVDTSGERVTLKVKAGRDTAEWAYDRPDVTPYMQHRSVRVADKVWVTDPDGRRYQANLYFSDLKLDRTRTVARVEFHYTYPKGKVRLYGMMLWENPNTAHQVLGRDKFIPRYEDDEVVIMENPSRLPQAFLVPTARVLKQPDIMDTMVHGDFDPEKVVLLETRDHPSRNPLPDTGLADQAVDDWLRGNPNGKPGSAQIVGYHSTEVDIRTESDRNAALVLSDSFYPGWKATVDGNEVKVYRADYLFRAVLVPPGKHEVRFVFEPESVALGSEISRFSVATLLILWAVLLPGVYGFRAVRGLVGGIRQGRSR